MSISVNPHFTRVRKHLLGRYLAGGGIKWDKDRIRIEQEQGASLPCMRRHDRRVEKGGRKLEK